MRYFLGMVVLFAAYAMASAAQYRYAVTDLGGLGSVSAAFDINDAGQAVGAALSLADGHEYAVLYADGKVIDVGLAGAECEAVSINNSGQVAVNVCFVNTMTRHAFIYDNGKTKPLGTFSDRDGLVAFAINDSGQIVGDSYLADSQTSQPFLYTDGQVQFISTLGSPSYASDINNHGQMVCNRYSSTAAYLYSIKTQDLTMLEGMVNAMAINDAGQVVGTTADPATGTFRATLYSGGLVQDLGGLGGAWACALDINNAGQVVGHAALGNFGKHAFLYSDGIMSDLNSLIDPASGWQLLEARSINNSGQIVGNGINPDGIQRGFLLTPIPEPTTLSLLALATAVSIRRRVK